MKKILLGGLFLLSILSFQKVSAQVRVNVNVNIGSQPNWGPAGYDYVEYYYLPDIESYYYVPTRQFIYLSGGNWVFSAGLPPMYRSYNLYSGYKVVINRPKAYLYHPSYKVKYAGYKGNRSQSVIKYGKTPKYKKSNGHSSGKQKRGNNGRGRH